MTTIQTRLNRQAIQFGEGLMPVDCIDIMENTHGTNRMEMLSLPVISYRIQEMMSVLSDCDYADEINECVNSWMNDF